MPVMRYIAQKAAGYYAGARTRAKRRKSAWNAVFIPVCFAAWLSIWYALFRVIWWFHSSLYPEHRLQDFLGGSATISFRSFVCGFLMMFGPLPGAIVIAFMLGNTFFWLISPVRRIFDDEARGYPGASFRDSMQALLKIGTWVLPIGVFLAIVGAFFLKSLR
jgi:hypothetical protein